MFQKDYVNDTTLEGLHKKYLQSQYAKPEKKVLEKTGIEIGINGIDDICESSRFVLDYEGIKWECLYINPKRNGKLYVVLNGSRNKGESPVFKRWSWAQNMDGAVLNIDDPMCQIYEDLSLGWYYGSENIDYCQYIVDIVEKIKGCKEVVFYASSGGGAAALRCALKMKGSTAIVINPQIRLDKFFYAKEFERITGKILEEDTLCRNNPCSLIKDNYESRFIIISNIAAGMDRVQIQELLDLYNKKSYRLGLNELDSNVMLWLYDANAGKPHENQEWLSMHKLIAFLNSQITEGRINEELAYLYSIYSDLWFERYQMQRSINKLKRTINPLENVNFNNCVNKIYDKNELILDKRTRDSEFLHITLINQLKQNRIYHIVLEDVLANSTPIIAVKDGIFEELIFSHELNNGTNVVTFKTSSDTEKMEIRIYPMNPPIQNICTCSIKNIVIYEC